MKFTKYKLITFLSLLLFNSLFTFLTYLFTLKKLGQAELSTFFMILGFSFIVFFFLLLSFKAQEVLNINHFVPTVWFIFSILGIIAPLKDLKDVEPALISIMTIPFSMFTTSFYWIFLRPKEQQAEENKKSAEDKKIEEKKLAEENKKLESAQKSEIKMKRHLLFFIPVLVLCPLSNFLLQNEMFSVSQLMILTAGQYVGYFLFTLFFFITKKFSSPQRLKQHIVTTFVIGTIGMIWVLSDNFFRQSAGIGFFIAVLCSALSWYTKDLKGISIINKK